jgi:hypothetical protein
MLKPKPKNAAAAPLTKGLKKGWRVALQAVAAARARRGR